MRKFRTADGGVILIPQKAEGHLRAHPEVSALLPETIGRVVLPSDNTFLSTEVEMGRVVGRSGCVQALPINVDDCAIFAQRVGRGRSSRVVIGEGEETTKVVVLAFPARGETGTYVLVTSWVGSLACKEPWDPMIKSQEEYQECLRFWCSHALVWDSTVMSEPFKSSWEEILK